MKDGAGLKPSGDYVYVGGELVVVGRLNLRRGACDDVVKVRDVISGHMVAVPPHGRVIERVETIAWWNGVRVEVGIRRGGGMRLAGAAWSSSHPQPDGLVVDDAGQVSYDVEDFAGLLDVNWTEDRLSTETIEQAGVWLLEPGEAPSETTRLRSTEPMPFDSSLGYQTADGNIVVPSEQARLFWRRKIATLHGHDVEVWHEEGSQSWIVFQDRDDIGVAGSGWLGVVSGPAFSSVTGAWVPTSELQYSATVERHWSAGVPSYLPQGAYGMVRGTGMALDVRGVSAVASRGPFDTAVSRSIFPPHGVVLTYDRSRGWATIGPGEATNVRVIETTALVGGYAVSLARPYNEIADEGLVLVRGDGEAPRGLEMDDGFSTTPRQVDADYWTASVRLIDLTNVQVGFVL
ncbi:hypothetical protein ACPEEZ_01525 [Frigoribacterium sp. 2-23]|uniref:hypothetical protein n=1 Tax=Frigoribacterium sp. 2-23 TaxID=3415006 RepID=UPI003C6F3167